METSGETKVANANDSGSIFPDQFFEESIGLEGFQKFKVSVMGASPERVEDGLVCILVIVSGNHVLVVVQHTGGTISSLQL